MKRGNKSRTARDIGLSRQLLYYRHKQRAKDILKIKILTKVAASRNRPHIHLGHFYFSIKKLFKKRPWLYKRYVYKPRSKDKAQKSED